ncbi:hypothetical protein [Streptomyces sp. NPDC127119]|uniref:hypothetical protein n=1 Tax=Streptomyces sp. NPDC127119 TaxID=3345370 RepID=UPI003637FD36
MARSTIQEKFSGKSPAKLQQVLSLVAAIAEYGRLHGTPLTPQEVDENSWRAKFVASNGTHAKPPLKGTLNPPNPSGMTIAQKWDLEPLERAGMTDLVDLIEQSQGAPPHTWITHVASEMRQAEMSCESLMEWAAKSQPADVVQCISALDQIFPLLGKDPTSWTAWSPDGTATVSVLLRHTARLHGTRYAPVIVVGLRRSKIGVYVRAFIRNVACWHLKQDIEVAVNNLKAAELTKDAMNLLRELGAARQPDRIMEVVRHFHDLGRMEERDAILGAMATESKRFMVGIHSLHGDPMLDKLIGAVPSDKRAEYKDKLNAKGHESIAAKIPPAPQPPSMQGGWGNMNGGGYSDEPPF